MAFEVLEGEEDGRVVGVDNLFGRFLGPEGVKKGDRFGSPEGEIEAGHPSLVVTMVNRLAGGRIATLENRRQLPLADISFEPEIRRAAAEPVTRGLAGAQV